MCCLESVNFFRNYVIFEDSALTFLPLLLYNEICICLRIPKSDRHNNITTIMFPIPCVSDFLSPVASIELTAFRLFYDGVLPLWSQYKCESY